MYKYSKRTIIFNFIFAGLLLILGFYIATETWYMIVVGLIALLILKDAVSELRATFELAGDRMIVRNKDKVVKEIKYRDIKYMTITRRNKKWIVLADDNGILFTIKPRIENYEQMAADLIRLNQSNKKLEVHDYIKKTYKK
ncbi:hypothetical protein EZV73_14040 [Acidaminobacter sp. JC074]|uniref:hypothetical protein n=1 Tax=Acidaminobacter sp. JC074 TaxID=2530199 RepID=UPI001F0DF6A3|nr:hypothetical protein [Acidaminobacter sp. JC074]MCH4888710.1 hypothetical protein [Acidaminobacter sp. JC074]